MSEQGDRRTPEQRGRDFLAGLADVPDDQDDVLFEARVEVLREVMPDAGPRAELRLRLAGPTIRDGFYDSEVESALAEPLSKELTAAGGAKGSQHVDFGLVGVSAGSVVLHYRPRVLNVAAEGSHEGVEVVPADQAIRRVLRLHNLFESQAPADEIRAATLHNDQLLRGARDVVHALTKFDLEMSAAWWSPRGDVQRSRLTRAGRTYAEGVFTQSEASERVQIWGMVAALDVDGLATIRRAKRQHRVGFDPEQIDLFPLGEQVRLVANRRAHVDQVGLSGHPRFEFERMVETGEDVPFDLDESGEAVESG